MKKDKTLTFKTTEEIQNKIAEIANREDRSISYIINRIITEYFINKESPA